MARSSKRSTRRPAPRLGVRPISRCSTMRRRCSSPIRSASSPIARTWRGSRRTPPTRPCSSGSCIVPEADRRSPIEARRGPGMTRYVIQRLILMVGTLIGVPTGVLSAVKANSPIDHFVRSLSVAGVALPAFMMGMLLQMVFYGWLGWLPLQGRMTSTVLLDHQFPTVTGLYLVDSLLAHDWVAFRDAAAHIVLPLATLTLANLPLVARTTRNLMVEALSEDYVRTAFAYSLPRRDVYFRYALKATLIPLLTVIGLTYGYLLGGAVVAEYVFDWPGIGGYVVRAITQSDYPAAVGVTLFLAAAYLTINLIVDLLYFAVDPRLRRP